MSVLIENPKVSAKEYFEGEELSEYKHEYEDGQIVAMVGASCNHNTIRINLAGALFNHLRPPLPRLLLGHESAQPEHLDYYPDLSASREKEQHDQYMERPLLVAEVFPPSSEKGWVSERYEGPETPELRSVGPAIKLQRVLGGFGYLNPTLIHRLETRT